MSKPIYTPNGPNLNRLGRREPEIYGKATLAEIESVVPPRAAGEQQVVFRQTNSEQHLIDWIHEASDEGGGIIINPAGYSFTSIAILDALKMFKGPIIELHITNIHRARRPLPPFLHLEDRHRRHCGARPRRLHRRRPGDDGNAR